MVGEPSADISLTVGSGDAPVGYKIVAIAGNDGGNVMGEIVFNEQNVEMGEEEMNEMIDEIELIETKNVVTVDESIMKGEEKEKKKQTEKEKEKGKDKEKGKNPDDIGNNNIKSNTEKVDLLKSVLNFQTPISIFGLQVQSKINSNIRLQNSEKTEVIQKVVEQMQKTYTTITNFTIQAVALKLHSLYPILNQVDDEGNLIGDGNYTTIRQIKDRLYYLTSQSKSSEKKKRPSSGTSLKNRSAGCTNYNPKIQISNNDALKMKTWLQNEHKKVGKHRNSTKIKQFLTETFAHQRDYILELPVKPVTAMVDEWPLLFEEKYLVDHFKMLCSLQYTSKDLMIRFKKIHKYFRDDEYEERAETNNNELIHDVLVQLKLHFKPKKGAEDFFGLLEVATFLNFLILFIFTKMSVCLSALEFELV